MLDLQRVRVRTTGECSSRAFASQVDAMLGSIGETLQPTDVWVGDSGAAEGGEDTIRAEEAGCQVRRSAETEACA